MSGGRFDYLQYRFSEIIDAIEQEILDNDAEPKSKHEWFEPNRFKPETLDEFRKGIEYLKKAQIYAQRIDWLLSGDDGEETFHKRLAKDLGLDKKLYCDACGKEKEEGLDHCPCYKGDKWEEK